MSNDQSAEQRRPLEGETGEGREPESEGAEARDDRPDTEELEPGQASDTGAEAGAPTGKPESGADPEADAVEEGDEAGDDATAEIARLDAELEAARAQADENWQRFVRSEAEKENIRKRAEKDSENARRQGMEKLATELLSVRDSLELGAGAAAQEDADLAKIREGTELTLKMLTQAMAKFDIEEIDPMGEKFDPDLHQAMSMQEVEGQESNTVVSVMQKGYRLGDRLLRPALVMVAK